jgi:hypothetical protein
MSNKEQGMSNIEVFEIYYPSAFIIACPLFDILFF